MHATDRVINLLTDQERLISIVGSSIGDGPHNLVLPLEILHPLPSIGERAFFDGDVLRLNGFEADISNASHWDARQDWAWIRNRKKDIAERIPEVRTALEDGAPDEGILAILDGKSIEGSGMDAHFSAALIQPAAQVVSGLSKGDKELALSGAIEISGLGSGLTPAGDDYLTGAMLACWAGFTEEQVAGWLGDLAEQAAAHTSRLSAAYLRSAGEGLFGQIWHSLLTGLSAEVNGSWEPAVSTIVQIGHNSGAYTLAGFVNVVLADQQDDRLPESGRARSNL